MQEETNKETATQTTQTTVENAPPPAQVQESVGESLFGVPNANRVTVPVGGQPQQQQTTTTTETTHESNTKQ